MSSPSPLWYTTRGAGMVLLILLTAVVVLGVLTTRRWGTAGMPRFVTNDLHRSLALLTIVFLLLHIATAIFDSFAGLGLKDALIPFASSYRPLWLGLGVLSAELFIALVVTSLARNSLGYRGWRLTHWLAYISWPLALVHGLGTGSDTKAGWALLINVVCILAVLIALAWRIAAGWPLHRGLRLGAVSATAAATLALVAWMAAGPLRPGWAAAAGTPASLLPHVSGSASTAGGAAAGATPAPLSTGLQDQLQGTLSQDESGTLTLDLSDTTDSSLRVTIVVPQDASVASLQVQRNGQTICSTQASVGRRITGSCGSTSVTVTRLEQLSDSSIAGVLLTSGA